MKKSIKLLSVILALVFMTACGQSNKTTVPSTADSAGSKAAQTTQAAEGSQTASAAMTAKAAETSAATTTAATTTAAMTVAPTTTAGSSAAPQIPGKITADSFEVYSFDGHTYGDWVQSEYFKISFSRDVFDKTGAKVGTQFGYSESEKVEDIDLKTLSFSLEFPKTEKDGVTESVTKSYYAGGMTVTVMTYSGGYPSGPMDEKYTNKMVFYDTKGRKIGFQLSDNKSAFGASAGIIKNEQGKEIISTSYTAIAIAEDFTAKGDAYSCAYDMNGKFLSGSKSDVTALEPTEIPMTEAPAEDKALQLWLAGKDIEMAAYAKELGSLFPDLKAKFLP